MSQSYKKILWVNPSFLDYRIPLYDEVNKMTDGNFHLIYSKGRIPERCDINIKKSIGDNAHPLAKEKIIGIGNRNNNFANSSLSIPFPKGLYKEIKKVNPDAIIAEGFFQFTPWAVWYTFFHRKPLYIAYERTAHTERNCPLWRRLYRKFINLFVTGYLANGKLTKEYLISQGVKADRIQTGGMCADSKGLAEDAAKLSESEKSILKTKYIPDGNGLVYLIVGRMIELKGVNYALDAWIEHVKTHTEDQILLVGDGPLLEEYKSKYADYPSIKFIGGIDYSQIYKFYAIADVFVIATLEDNWSLVVPEAMACGLPVTSSIYNGCHPELVQQDVNGITFDTLKQDKIIAAFDYFHHKDLNQLGEASKRIESRYNPHETAINVLNMIDTIK